MTVSEDLLEGMTFDVWRKLRETEEEKEFQAGLTVP